MASTKQSSGGGTPGTLADITTGPTVVRTPSAVLVEDPGGTPVKHDLSCAVRYWDHTGDQEELDARTFCNPGGTEVGAVSHGLTVGLYWSEELDATLRPLAGAEVQFEFKDNDDDTQVVAIRSRFGVLPFGRHEVGQLVEVDLVCAVLSDPILTTPTP